MPKLEHAPGRKYRILPLFEQTRRYLADAFEMTADGAEYPDEWPRRAQRPNKWRDWNLRRTFEKILLLAETKPWPRLCASSPSDLAGRFPITKVTAWIRNRVAITARHSVSPLDADFRLPVENHP
ncbi:MAG: hypothetical protein ACUVQK_04415 [Thermogutta sp.]